jgi:hypothetical protein
MDFSTAKFGPQDQYYPYMPLNGTLSVDVAPGGYDVPPYISVYNPTIDNNVSNVSGATPDCVDYQYSYVRSVYHINSSDIVLQYMPAATLGSGNARVAKQGSHAFVQLTPMISALGTQAFCSGEPNEFTTTANWSSFTTDSEVPLIEVKNQGASTMTVKIHAEQFFAVPLTDMMMSTANAIVGVDMKYDRQTLLLAPMSGIGSDPEKAVAHAATVKTTTDHPGLTGVIVASAKAILSPAPSGDHAEGMLHHLISSGAAALAVHSNHGASAPHHGGFLSGLFGAIKKFAPMAGEVVDAVLPQAAGLVSIGEQLADGLPDN